MNHRVMQQNAFAACEEMRGTAAADRRHPVFCPKPQRLCQLSGAGDFVRPLRWYASYQPEPSDSKAGAELLDLFLTKGGDQGQVASSPPFFCGSPPSRSANPVVQDARFGEEKPVGPFLPTIPVMSHGSSPMSPSRKGCAPTKFGLKPAAVRVEGFDCDRRSRSITAVA